MEEIISKATGNLETKITRTQNLLFETLINKLKELETDAEGYIKQTAANRKILNEASQAFDSAIKKSPYKKSIEQYLGGIPEIDATNTAYFKAIGEYSTNAGYLSNLRTQTITELETLMLNEGLESQIKQPLLNILNQNVNSSAKFTDMLKQVQEYIKGGADVDGKLMAYSKQITNDTLFNYSRSLQQAITSDLGLQWYLYAGGITEGGKYSSGSREFCINRVGKYFHHSEIEAWASRDWAGKRRGTTGSTIFTYAGGYSCRHQIIAVDSSIVPESIKARIH